MTVTGNVDSGVINEDQYDDNDVDNNSRDISSNNNKKSKASQTSYCKTKLYMLPAVREIFGTAITKIFIGGFMWQGFAFICYYGSNQVVTSDSWIYALVTGIGDGFGVFIGNMIRLKLESISMKHTNNKKKRIVRLIFTPSGYPGHNSALRDSAAVSFGAFLAGFAWQPLVNVASDELQLSFNSAMAFVGVCCGTIFFIGYTFGIYMFIRRKVWDDNIHALQEISLALGVFGSAAFFVGTADNVFSDNWLSKIVGVRDGEYPMLDCLKAGFSTFLGFVTLSLVLYILVPNQFLWMTAKHNFELSEEVMKKSTQGNTEEEINRTIGTDDNIQRES